MPGVICDRMMAARIKAKVHKMVVRPARMYDLETMALTKKPEAMLGKGGRVDFQCDQPE